MGDRPAAIHGNWGLWSEWASCSATCGAGVEAATRHCNNPAPANGGRYCTGERRKYRICNTQECPENEPSFRATQCSKFDSSPYKGHNYTWQAVTVESYPCQLHCKPDNEFYSVELEHSVIDGTPCKPGTRDLCIHGVCKRIACDWTIEGSAQEDRCGICHGDGTQCVTTKGRSNVTHGVSYVPIASFPKGAINLRVEEMGDAANYLAIRDYETGRYHLNGNWIIQWSGEYSASGSMMYYKRENETETLFMPGPLKRKLTLMLLFQMRNPGVIWEYTVAHENATYTPVFSWHHADWTICSQTCGGGIQVANVQCHEKEAGLVEDRYCLDPRPTDLKQECNTQTCPAWWWSGPWQPCSVTCGGNGTRRRTVICVRSYGPTEQMALMDSNCPIESKPHEYQECPDLQMCPTEMFWEAQPWIQSCRGDPCEFQTRIVKCLSTTGFCDSKTRPNSIKQCGDISCGRWEVGNWEKCSTTCGEGVQIRTVECVGGSACIRVDEPASVKECNVATCPSKNYETIPEWWHVMPTDFVKTKTIISSNDSYSDHKDPLKNSTPDKYSSDGSMSVDESSIDDPNKSKTSSIIHHHRESFEKTDGDSSDSTLSESLGNEDRTIIGDSSTSTGNNTNKEVSNVTLEKQSTVRESFVDYSAVPDEYYDDLDVESIVTKTTTIPSISNVTADEEKLTSTHIPTMKGYSTAAASSKYLTTDNPNNVLDVSVQKVDTKKNIKESKIDEKNKIKDDNFLLNDNLSNNKLDEDDIPIPESKNSDRIEVIKTERSKTKNESTTDKYYNDYDYDDEYDYDSYDYDDDILVAKVERPTGIVEDKIEIEDFQAIEVVKKKNKRHKGKKNKFKKVKIHTGMDAFNVLQKFTKRANKKKYRKKYNVGIRDVISPMTPEFKWTVGPWSKCSEPCGGASKLRTIECHNSTSNSLVPPWKCHALPPPDMQYCNMFKCQKWTLSDYSECSQECGPGIRTMNATCPKKGKCHPRDLPSLQENCTKQPCVKWVEGPWSMCTKSCGGGYQIRFVKCVDSRTQEASTDCEEDKPPHKKVCNSSKCQKRQSQQSDCKDHLDKKLCRRLVHMCKTKFFGVKCCRTCNIRRRG